MAALDDVFAEFEKEIASIPDVPISAPPAAAPVASASSAAASSTPKPAAPRAPGVVTIAGRPNLAAPAAFVPRTALVHNKPAAPIRPVHRPVTAAAAPPSVSMISAAPLPSAVISAPPVPTQPAEDNIQDMDSSKPSYGKITESKFAAGRAAVAPYSSKPTSAAAAAAASEADSTAQRIAALTAAAIAQQGDDKPKKILRTAAGEIWEDATLAEWPENDFRIFCGDLGNEVNDTTLGKAFQKYPSFQKAKVIRDKKSQKSKGYGFVSFTDPQDFARALVEMNGKYVGNRPVKLRKSTWKDRDLMVARKKKRVLKLK